MCHFNSLFREYSTAIISALETYRTLRHLRSTRYSFKPEWSEARENGLPCPRTQHRNNDVTALRVEKYTTSLKILHQADFELARQVAAIVKRYALTIASRPSLSRVVSTTLDKHQGSIKSIYHACWVKPLETTQSGRKSFYFGSLICSQLFKMPID